MRRNGPLWTQVIIWSSIAGCTLCVLGLIAGLVRLSPRRRFSLRGAPSMSPYSGWMKWHHYAGLIFGVVTFTWTFSGLLSMGPFALLSSGGASAEQRRAVTGTITGLEALGVDTIKQAATSAAAALAAKELALVQFRGRPYWLASESPARHVLIDATHPEQRPFARFDDESMAAAARDAGSTSRIIDATWLDAYDDYYYDRRDARPLPVLRVRYDDPQRTWMYLEPSRGAIALVVTNAGSGQPVALPRPAQFGHGLDLQRAPGLGSDGDRTQPGRHRGRCHQPGSCLASAQPSHAPMVGPHGGPGVGAVLIRICRPACVGFRQ